MKILYYGGQKSGKTSKAISKTLYLSKEKKPFYVATYLNKFKDKEMQKRVDKHILERGEKFETIEEGKDLIKATKQKGVYLIDCLSMWIFNNLKKEEEELITHIKRLLISNNDIVFILNETNSGVTPMDKESRKFIDMSGIIGQVVANSCDEVYNIVCGIEVKIK